MTQLKYEDLTEADKDKIDNGCGPKLTENFFNPPDSFFAPA